MAHPGLDALLNAVLPFAQQTLAKHGELYPVGAAMNVDGQVGLIAGMPESEHPESQQIIEMLVAGLHDRALKREIRASVVCFDGRVVPPGATAKVDAICAHLEHESGEYAAVFLPYRKGLLGRLKYGELFASRLEPRIFASTAG